MTIDYLPAWLEFPAEIRYRDDWFNDALTASYWIIPGTICVAPYAIG